MHNSQFDYDNATPPDDDGFDEWANSEEGAQWHWSTSEALAKGLPVYADDHFGIRDKMYLLEVVKMWGNQEWRTLDTELKRQASEAWADLADAHAAMAMCETHESIITAERSRSAYMEVICKLADKYASDMMYPYWCKYVMTGDSQ